MNGWIMIHRDILDHWIWKDPIKFYCWIDILATVNYEDKKVVIGNQLYECKRGQALLSLQSWAERWKMSKSAARNVISLLEQDHMIRTESITKSTRLTVCNYDYYQDPAHASKTREKRIENASHTQHNTSKEDKKENKKGNKLPFNTVELAFIKVFNECSGRAFKTLDEKSRKQFESLLSEGYKSPDFIKTIKMARSEMSGRRKLNYLTPEFITRPTEFLKYFNMDQKNNQITEVYIPSNGTNDDSRFEPVRVKPYNPNEE